MSTQWGFFRHFSLLVPARATRGREKTYYSDHFEVSFLRVQYAGPRLLLCAVSWSLVVQCLLTHVKVKCRNETGLGNLKSS